MKTNVTKWATKAAGAGAVALLLATPAVAQSRGDWNQREDARQSNAFRGNDNRDGRDYRSGDSRANERINATGRIASFTHERNGYRVRLDRDNRSFWVPESSFRGRDLRVGVSISLGGVFRDGAIYVDAVNWPADGYGYNGRDRGFVRGVIERIDRRDGTLLVRDDGSGRTIRAELNGGIGGLRRGDYVEMRGRWIGGGTFDAMRVDLRR